MQNTKLIQNFFDETAAIYPTYFDLVNKTGTSFNFNKRMQIIGHLVAGSTGRLLDCAVGDGRVTAYALECGQFTEAILVDLSPKMLKLAQGVCQGSTNTGIGIQYLNSDIFDFAQSQNSLFDIIICSGLIAHLNNPADLLDTLGRILSPNGKIILQTTLLDHPVTWLVKQLTADKFLKNNGYKISYYTSHKIAALCKETALRIERVEKFSMGLQFLDRVLPSTWNYYLESRLDTIAQSMGSEAIYVLGR
ncbi:MAG: class I SAM-dependent methyltransferase [Moorea sp. SIO4A1]|uniref:class I SAM-dependent methyltransferase n=1 Tax=Moorena sp. SIO4A1 TaxID=2607835 RepID=UPI00144F940B|nr:class I SAM-dependent methyltransferase [Moorena sp. SIO4A1]NEQ63566.1 class I SAM-dependent methyltransferase [Moorena sp. SIO4A1]